MFRKWPLTTLFIIATICVDVAVLISAKGGAPTLTSSWNFYFWSWFVPAQFCALALWSVFGKTHRLTKAAWTTLAFAILLTLIWIKFEPLSYDEIIGFSFVHFIAVLTGAAFFKLCGVGKEAASSTDNTFRISLVEIFGWSLIAALWAFGMRFVDEGLLIDKYFIAWFSIAAAIPVLLIPVLFSAISTTKRIVAFMCIISIAFIGYMLTEHYIPDNPISMWVLTMAVTQISYISAWWAVMRMDEAMQERQAITEASREKLKVFEPSKID
jgi:hypothetical protein